MVRGTSIKAYREHRESGKLGKQQQKIYIVLKHSPTPLTNRELATCTGIEPSTVSARRNELMDNGLVEDFGKRKCRVSGRLAIQWGIKNE